MNKFISAIKKIKIRTLLLLIVLLAFSSYAWFIFVDTVSTGLDAHIVSWDVKFELNDTEVEEISIDAGRIYPGMDDYSEEIVITNNGEVDGVLSYQVQRMVILGEVYEVTNDVTYADLQDMLENDFPFSIVLEIDGEDTDIIPVGESSNVTISIVWPFEGGDDELDTQWGEDAYEYYQENGPDSIAVHLELLLRVEQLNDL